MKNKEIEELLKYLKNKFYISGEFYTEEKIKVLSKKELELLLSYIEQLENDNKDLDKENQMLFETNLNLQNNRDKAIKYVEEKGRLKYNPNELINLLKGDSDYE